MKKIKLNGIKGNGKYALVDGIDYEWMNQYRWYLDDFGYAECTTGGRKNKKHLIMHRLIMNTPNDMDTDHANGNTLDNRRRNLRVCTTSQNLCNSRIRSDNKSGHKGVSWDTRLSKWRVYINFNFKRFELGYFIDKLEAIEIRKEATIRYHGEYARL